MSIIFRNLNKNDYSKGFLNVLNQLTKVGNINFEMFEKKFNEISKNKNHKILVGELNNKIVCTATLLIEPKFIHECKNTGQDRKSVV